MKNFSPRAKEIIAVFAQDEARKMGSKQLLPEHVILAILKNEDGLAYSVFSKLLTLGLIRRCQKERLH